MAFFWTALSIHDLSARPSVKVLSYRYPVWLIYRFSSSWRHNMSLGSVSISYRCFCFTCPFRREDTKYYVRVVYRVQRPHVLTTVTVASCRLFWGGLRRKRSWPVLTEVVWTELRKQNTISESITKCKQAIRTGNIRIWLQKICDT
jgi:hypothetical protein